MEVLEGRQLTAVTFVWDYVQVQFTDAVLSCFNLPGSQTDAPLRLESLKPPMQSDPYTPKERDPHSLASWMRVVWIAERHICGAP